MKKSLKRFLLWLLTSQEVRELVIELLRKCRRKTDSRFEAEVEQYLKENGYICAEYIEYGEAKE